LTLLAARLGGRINEIARVLNQAPGNDAPIGNIKVSTKSGWYGARPSKPATPAPSGARP
jgi:phosphoglucomutase